MLIASVGVKWESYPALSSLMRGLALRAVFRYRIVLKLGLGIEPKLGGGIRNE